MSLHDPRNTQLAQVFVDHSVKVKEGDKVVISMSDLGPVDLLRETYRLCLERGAFVYLDIMGFNYFLGRSSYGDLNRIFLQTASQKQIENPPEIYKHISEWGDKYIRITSLENYTNTTDVGQEKLTMHAKSYHEWFRTIIDERDWVLTYYPTEGMAQQAGMSLSELFDIYFDACCVDYNKMEKEGKKLEKLMDQAKKVRIVGDKTDITIDITDRLANASSGTHNVPDGEVFLAPVHLKTEGHIYYDLPFMKGGKEMNGVYLQFKDGKVVKSSAEMGEDALNAGLDSDKGARYLGELGLGINYGIQRVMKNTLFDEKIGGTVHVTLGEAYTYERGGNTGKDRNVSSIHWDLVKDMRKPGSYIEVDGKVKFKEGKWLLS